MTAGWGSAVVVLVTCRRFKRAICGRTARTSLRSCSAAALRDPTRVTAPDSLTCSSFAVARALFERMTASCLFVFYRHRALVHSRATSASCLRRPLVHDARSPLGRYGAASVRASLRLPCASGATTRLHATSLPFTSVNVFWRFKPWRQWSVSSRFPASCRVAPGGIASLPCLRAGSCGGHPGRRAFGEGCSTLRVAASCRKLRRPSWPSPGSRTLSEGALSTAWRLRAEGCDALRVHRFRR